MTSTLNSELKPCPFCDGPARIEGSAMWLDLICEHESTCCLDGDSAELSYQNTPDARERMVAKWNRRAQSPAAPNEPVQALPELPKPWKERIIDGAFSDPRAPGFAATGASAIMAAMAAENDDLRELARAAIASCRAMPAKDEARAYMQGQEAAYPIPDSPHQSVIDRAMANRIAYRKGWDDRAALAASSKGEWNE